MKTFSRAPVPCWIALGVAVALPVPGQQQPEFLTAVPESPAFTLLGATPAQVARPASVRDLSLALINGVAPDGKVLNGFAIEASLWQLIPDLRIPLQEYQQSRLKYLLANTQLSLGTVAHEGDAASTDLGFGVKISFLDRGDPMASPEFTRGLGDALVDCLPDNPEMGEEETAAELECVDKLIAARWNEHARENWNAARLSLALATRWTFEDSDFDRMENNGFRAWLTGGLAMSTRGMALGQIEYRDQPEFGTLPSADSLSAGARVLFGSPGINGFLEVTSERVSSSAGDENRTSWSVGADIRVAGSIWISAGFGRRFEDLLEDDDDAKTAVLANLKWGITSQSRISTLRP